MATVDIQEMSRRFGVSYRTLHYYEQLELLRPIRRGRWRRYTPKDQWRLTLILRLRHFGFLLEEIRQYLLILDREGAGRQLEVWRSMADRRIGALERQRSDLDDLLDELRLLCDATTACALAGHCPELFAPDDAAPRNS